MRDSPNLEGGCVRKVRPKIVVVGSSNTDLIVKVPRLPEVGETVTGGVFSVAPGGKGANQAVQAARLGAEVWFVGRVGEDEFGRARVEDLKREGINTEFVAWDKGAHSGVAFILVDERGENMIAVAPGSNAMLSASDVERAEGAIRSADALLLQFEIPEEAILCAERIAKEGGTLVVVNPAPWKGVSEEVFRLADVVAPNEIEARGIVGKDGSPEELAASILDKGPKIAVVTLGRRGAVCMERGGKPTYVSAFGVEAVDATAAGDAFCAGLTVALVEGKPLPEAVRFACACAAIAVTRLGAQPSLPRREEVEGLLGRPQMAQG